MAKHLLTAMEVKNAKGPHQKGGSKYHADGEALFLQVSPTGSRSWVFRRRDSTGKSPEVGLGSYPEVTLGKARAIAGAMWTLTSAGVSAKQARDTVKGQLQVQVVVDAGLPAPDEWTFAKASEEYIRTRIEPEARNLKHVAQWRTTLSTYAGPTIGGMLLDDIELKHILQVLTPIWHITPETGKRVRQRIERILDWSRIMGYRSTGENPARWKGYLDNVLPSPDKIRVVQHMPSMPYAALPEFFEKLREKPGTGARALEFLILNASRSGEVRGARWEEINLDKAVWKIPGSRMKGNKAHMVPLSPASVAILEALPQEEGVVFKALRGGSLSDMTLTKVMRDMGIKDAVVHGFRSTFKEWCRECTQFPDEISELALAHVSTDATRAAYARSDLLELRRSLMESWAGYVTDKPMGKVIPMKKKKAE